MKTLEGKFQGDGLRVALVYSRTNAFIGDRLLEGALEALRKTGCSESDIEVVRVPGAFEIPQTARALVQAGGQDAKDAIVCIGVVLRGATPHFDHIASAAIRGVAEVALLASEQNIVVTMGILTCDTLEQAIERAGTKGGNKGFEAAMAAVELADLRRSLGAEALPSRLKRIK